MYRKLLGTLAVLGLVWSVANVNAASKGSLYLVGKIKVLVDIYVDPVLGSADTLDVVNGETSRLIANVQESTNNKAGYRIEMTSVNAGNLKHSDGTSQVAYTIAYDGGTAAAPGAVGTPVTVKTTAAAGTDTSPVNINITGVPAAAAGVYTDTLIFAIVAL